MSEDARRARLITFSSHLPPGMSMVLVDAPVFLKAEDLRWDDSLGSSSSSFMEWVPTAILPIHFGIGEPDPSWRDRFGHWLEQDIDSLRNRMIFETWD